MKIISATDPEFLNLSNDLQIELSLISSGLIIADIESSVIFIIKDTAEMIKGFYDLKSVSLNFTSIPRPEFPTVNCDLRLKNEKDLSVKYEYFFNSDSEYELNLLKALLNQNVINLYFFADIPEKCVTIEMEVPEIKQLKKCLSEI